MRIGVFYFPTDYGINLAELARALEDRGFDSLFVPEHTHIPVSRRTPFPGGGELPKRYSHTHDPFVALAFAAAATKKLLARHRHLPGAAARSDRHRQGHRHARPAVGRPLRLRHRRRLERRRDGEPRRALCDALQADARARAGHEGAVDRGGGVVPRRVREVRSGVVVAQAGAAAASADPAGRRERPYAEARRRVTATAGSRAPRGGFEPVQGGRPLASDGGAGGPGSLDARRSPCSARAKEPRCSRATRRPASTSALLGDSRREPRRDPALSRQDRAARQARRSLRERRHRPRPDGVPFRRRRRLLALGRSLRGGRRRFAVADRSAGRAASRSSNAWRRWRRWPGARAGCASA